jgi:multidrug efflux pump subunit AcrA (membrane-fusion protein)
MNRLRQPNSEFTLDAIETQQPQQPGGEGMKTQVTGRMPLRVNFAMKSLRTSLPSCKPAVVRDLLTISRFLGSSLFVLGALAACSSKEEKPAPPPPGVTVAPVIQKEVPIHQEWVGTMVGNVDADIRPKVEGYLLKRLYVEGSFVQKGQPMFQLDRRQAEAAVEQATGNLERARAGLAQAQIDVRRYTPLVAQKAVSQAELDKAQSSERAATATVDANQAVLDNAKLNLNWTTVTSPMTIRVPETECWRPPTPNTLLGI